ncbi:acyl carrier protein [Mycobacterium sp. 1245852.3]|uniref:acyl carrier protein n=1 Tax=Mycobacterium sp. 1245852.3 TaxID=1856860 RepID=UPI000801D5A3|nr:acyl carrier protein [Mycobacterium sp. 1245852.3]OBJ84069.1 hypothetical protein A9W96_27360 [Mycobacterium sp. 1245852.3]
MTIEQTVDGYEVLVSVITSLAPVEGHRLDGKTTFSEIGLDSLMTLEVMLTCEDRLGLAVMGDDMPEIYTVGDAAELLDDVMQRAEVRRQAQ